MAKRSVQDGGRGHRQHHGGARLLHEPRDHAALHHWCRPTTPLGRDSRGCSARHVRLLEAYRALSPRSSHPGYGIAGAGNRLLSELLHGHARSQVTVEDRAGVSRISIDGPRLWQDSDDELRELARVVRGQWHEPNRATYMVMRIIATNVCRCPVRLLRVLRAPDRDGGYVLDHPQVFAKIDELLGVRGDVVAFRQGFNRSCPSTTTAISSRPCATLRGPSRVHALTVAGFIFWPTGRTSRTRTRRALRAGLLGDGWRQRILTRTFASDTPSSSTRSRNTSRRSARSSSGMRTTRRW